jgi:hypothetical protein
MARQTQHGFFIMLLNLRKSERSCAAAGIPLKSTAFSPAYGTRAPRGIFSLSIPNPPLTPASSLKGANLKNAVILSIPTRAASYGEE